MFESKKGAFIFTDYRFCQNDGGFSVRFMLTTVLCFFLTACNVSTVRGPIWPEQRLTGVAPSAACIVMFSVAIAGANPWLEQIARRYWQEALVQRQGRCAKAASVRVDVTNLATYLNVDAYGSPLDGNPQITPPPARQRLDLTADIAISRCRDAVPYQRTLRASGWLPYTADSFLAEEQATALLTELVQRQVSQLDTLLARQDCLFAAVVTAALENTTASEATTHE